MKKFLKMTAVIMLCGFLICLIAFAFILNAVFSNTNSIVLNKEKLISVNSKIQIYDNNSLPLESNYGKNAVITLKELPEYVPAAFISIEDKNFYSHNGINIKRMAKAMFNNLLSGYAKEGASTITQQLIKNTHLSNEKTVERKLKEIFLALKLEKEFTKEDILETYLNVIYFGNGAYGIENASQSYFSKSAIELTIDESATLAGIIKSPKKYSPIYNLEKCLQRRNLILNEMLKDKKITQNEFENAFSKPITLNLSNKKIVKNSAYQNAVCDETCKILHLAEKDLAKSKVKIYTYFNPEEQSALEKSLSGKNFIKNANGFKPQNAGIIINNNTGAISAFAGNDTLDLINLKRQPGSAIKPILVYAPAIENGTISPATKILDEQINIKGYSPQNVGGEFHGFVSVRESIEKSLNIPAIKILDKIGIENAKKFAEQVNISFDKKDNNYSLALGGFTHGTTICELANSYVPFANGGNFVEAKFIKKIEDENGKVVYENKSKLKRVMSEQTAYLMTDMLKSSTKVGTSKKLADLPFDVAGKTGTVGALNSNANTDVWSIAYTPEKVYCIWQGNTSGKPEQNLDSTNNGGTYSTLMIKDIMQSTLHNTMQTFKKPENIEEISLDAIEYENSNSLLLANENMPERYVIKEIFNKNYLPKQISENYIKAPTCSIDGKVKNGIVEITFDAKKHIIYDLYRTEEDNTIKLKTYQNESGKIIFEDVSANENTIYTYFITTKMINYATNETSIISKSKPIKIKTPSAEKKRLSSL